jgi:hypothetical protein
MKKMYMKPDSWAYFSICVDGLKKIMRKLRIFGAPGSIPSE